MYSEDIISRFSRLPVAPVLDACDRTIGKRCFMDHSLESRIHGKKIVGPAITVLEEKSEISSPPTHAIDLIDAAQGGEVIVVALKEQDPNAALWGALMATGADVHGIVGAVIDGGVRDVKDIRETCSLEVYSATVNPVSTVSRYVSVASNVPIVCGGITVTPGDLIMGDDDGVICIPQEHVMEVLLMAEDIEKKESAQLKYIRECGSLKEGMSKFNMI